MEWSPRVLLSAAPKNVEQRLKEYVGGKLPTNRWSRNFKPPPRPQTDVFGRVVPYIYRPIYGGKLRQGGPGRGVNLVKIKKNKE